VTLASRLTVRVGVSWSSPIIMCIMGALQVAQ
jgi:hypothetical protein